MQAHPEILFLGDSITEYWLYEGKEIWDKHFGRTCVNRGVSGHTVSDTMRVISRIHREETLHPGRWMLLIGANDILMGRSASSVAEGVGWLLEELTAQYPEAMGIIHGILPLSVVADGYRREAAAANELLEKLASRQGVKWFTAWDSFVQADGRIPFALMPDGVHLSRDAYQLWAAQLLPFFESTGFPSPIGL